MKLYRLILDKIKKEVYKHFKGTEVEVIGIALHSETEELMVVYNHPDPVKGKEKISSKIF